MTTHRRLSLPLLAAALLGATALTAQTAPAAGELTLDECVRRALQKNFDLEAQQYTTQIAQEGVTVAKDLYEPTFTASTSRSGTTTGATATSPKVTGAGSSTRLGVSQQFYTGTSVALSSQLDRSRIDPSVSALNPAYDADLTVSVRQQLLQGFGTAVNEAGLNRARLGHDRAKLDYRSVALTVVQSTENAYYNLVFAREQLDVMRFSLALAQRLLDEAKTRRATGVATDLDVAQAEVGVANARRSVLLAEQAVKNNGEALLALIGQFELESPLGATKLTEVGDALPLFASSYSLAKQGQPDLLSAQAAVEQARSDVLVAKDGARPSLSVGGAVGFNGRRGNGNDAYSDAFNNRNNSWQVDLSLSYPLGQVADKARYRQAVAALSQSQSRLRQLEQGIELQVRSAVRAVETGTESVKISTQARELSERQYELEKAKFDAGLSTSYLVLQAQNTLETARVAELQAKVSLRTAYAGLHRLEGSSLQRYGVQLP